MYLCGDVVLETMYTVTFSPEEEELIESYGKLTGMTVSKIIRAFTMEHRSDPRMFSFDEEMERLDLE